MKLAYDLYTPPFSVQSGLAPIILLHSIVETKDTWKPIALAIAMETGRRVYAVDSRNHGDSPWTEEYNVEIMSDDLKEFLCDHHIQQAVIIGHSLGGKVAIAFSLKEPSKVEKLIVEDSPVRKITNSTDSVVSSTLKLGRSALDGLTVEFDEKTSIENCRIILKGLAPVFSIEEDFADTYNFEYLPFKWDGQSLKMNVNIDDVIECVRNGSLQLLDVEGRYDGDALFIVGKKSQFKVHKDQSVEKHFPRATKVIFENSGHLIHHTFPNEFVRTVSDFINHGPQQRSKY